ncbi:carboxymuconolactone decarboxylase family protein [Nocardia sp. NEAU-G5]|uniref:Carboxymuconolactone decarboxylase family protein n=1 Tax=Nocardia albiluteola TaxID=2842303 RepID=A0ABS6AR62_9NOCA|nr:carboxymuconolactone decarboxylase family protein [Nocardia albiluteola]MBU3060515.1 carboxymuconolactone decarboxylase family protein [Nocardia albiluteola]
MTAVTPPSGVDFAALDPMFAQMGAATARHANALPGLTDREKALLRLTADVCAQALGLPFEFHLRTALRAGVTTADVRALLCLIAYDSGYHTALAAFDRLAALESALDLPRPDRTELPAELLTSGPDAPSSPLPAPVRDSLRELDPHFLDYFDLQSRMRSPSGPDTLSVRERAFATMSIDIHYQTLSDTFRIHIQRALGGGASLDDVRDVLRFNAQFGATRVWQAWKAFHSHAAEAGWNLG